MSRRSRPVWVYVLLSGLLGVFLLGLWLGGAPSPEQGKVPGEPAHTVQQKEPAAPAVVFEETGHESVAPAPEEEAMPAPPAEHHGIALILDDVGYDLPALHRALALHLPLTIAILPESPHAAKAAELAHKAGYPVMLHMPMEPANPRYSKKMDDSFIRVGMKREEVRRLMNGALVKVPYVVGVNNHMGSRLTALEQPMRWVMEVCREQKLFFVDSRTNKDSVAARLAREAGLRWGQRRVFLDDSVQPELLEKSWNAARKRLKRDGSVIVIAHPHHETLDFLEHKLTRADRASMVPISALLVREEAKLGDIAGR